MFRPPLGPTTAAPPLWLPWLDVAAIGAWGLLLLSYWLTGRLGLLIHPAYFWLAAAGGLGMAALAVGKAIALVREAQDRHRWGVVSTGPALPTEHAPLLPLRLASGLLLGAALMGLILEPQPFTSQKAVQRGITDAVTATRASPQAFRTVSDPADRTLIDWVRTLNVYPEPDAYAGDEVEVEGFVTRPESYPEDYFLISRFVITCCAADAYPVGLPVRSASNLPTYAEDTWLRVSGEMAVEDFEGDRQLVIQATELEEIPQPENPYEY